MTPKQDDKKEPEVKTVSVTEAAAPSDPNQPKTVTQPMEGPPSENMRLLLDMLAEQKAVTSALLRQNAIQELRIKEMEEKQASIDVGNVPIIRSHCNACGDDVEEGKKCARHPYENVHHIGRVLHPETGRPTLAIVRVS